MPSIVHEPPPGQAGPLVGFEIEAYASSLVTGTPEAEDEASPRSLRRVARHLRDLTGFPFKAVIPPGDGGGSPGMREPTSSPGYPIWAVSSDYSLDPCAAPDDEHTVGVEVITPPLDVAAATAAVRHVADTMSGFGDFAPGLEGGVHVNVSVPSLDVADAVRWAMLDPFRSAALSRIEGFADPLFDATMAYLPASYSGSPGVEDVVLAMVARSRGRHLTNVLPLLTGRGYIEFRHLSSTAFFSDPGRAVRLAERAVNLLAKPPRRRMDGRVRAVGDFADRLRSLGSTGLERAVASMPPADLPDGNMTAQDAKEKAERHLLITVLELAKSDPILRAAFPWAANYPEWPIRQAGRRPSYRSPYAIACVDKDAVLARIWDP